MTAEAGLGRGGREHFSHVGVGSALAVAVLMMAIIQVGMVVHGNVPVLDGILLDPDAYLRLVRVERLWQTGAWFDPVLTRINPPEGLDHHWTRPVDVLLLAGAWLASPVLGFKAGLYWWGVLFGPVLQVLSVCAILWAAAPVLRRAWLCLLAFLYIGQPGIFGMFLVGRPDHHGFLILLYILLIGFTVRMLLDPHRESAAVHAGLTGALAIWVSTESILPVVLSIAALGLSWLFAEPRYARLQVRYATSLLLALAAALLIERGPAGFLAAEVDRISGAHVLLLAVNVAFWTCMSFVERRHARAIAVPGRAAWGLLAAAAGISVLWLFNPAFFADPLRMGDELYLAKHSANIQELQPLVDLGAAEGRSFFEVAARPLLWLGIAVLALPWLIFELLESPGAEPRLWSFFALGALATLPMALAEVRWALYPELFLVVPYASLAGRVLDRLAIGLPRHALSVVRPLLVAGLCVWFYVPSAMTDAGGQGSAATETAERCSINALAEVLDDPDGLGSRPRLVLALIDFGPELLYRTRHSVLSVPNHRPQPGFTASYEIMTATDPDAARRRLEAAGVDLVLVCPNSAESWFYQAEGAGRTLHRALLADDPPPFLAPVGLPGPLARQFKLFEVR